MNETNQKDRTIPLEVGQLEEALPLHAYGRGEAKSFQQLLNEIASGEATIAWRDGRPVRLVRIVVLTVRCQGKTLIEDRQEFTDGRVRRRGFDSLSEKLHSQENYMAAVYRALQEELSLPDDELTNITTQFLGEEIEKKESPSYPGLESLYEKQRFRVDLPDNFYRPEYIELSSSGLRTYFVWR